MRRPVIVKIDLYLLLFFQKFADKIYEWIRIPIKHLAFFCFAGAIAGDIWWYYLAYGVLQTIDALLFPILSDLILYRIFWFGFTALEHRQICDKLHFHDIVITWFRWWFVFLSSVKIVFVLLYIHHITPGCCTTLCLTMYLFFISCKQKPLKKHPLKEWSENLAKRFERKNLQPA